jgi:hypothetical protein
MDIVVLQDVKAHLQIPDTITTYDDALIRFISAVTPVAEDMAGHIVPLAIVGEIHDGGQVKIATNHAPVISVESITEYTGDTGYPLTSQPLGASVDSYGYQLLSPQGIIIRRGGFEFACGRANVLIDYTVGCVEIPENVRLGSLELIRHWYQLGQQGGRPGFNSTGGDEAYSTGGDYAVPNFVAELFGSSPYSRRRRPGII